MLLHDGDSVEFDLYGTFAGPANENLLVSYGGTTIFDSGNIDPAGGGFHVYGVIVRNGASAQRAMATMVTSGLTLVQLTGPDLTLDNASAQALAVTASADNDADVTLSEIFVTFIGAPQ